MKGARELFHSKKKWQEDEERKLQRIITKIREDARGEKMKREKKELAKRIKEKWEEFLKAKRLEREIKKKERNHERERKKKILPDEGYGD